MKVYMATRVSPMDGEHVSRVRDMMLRRAIAQMVPDTYRWELGKPGEVNLYIEGKKAG